MEIAIWIIWGLAIASLLGFLFGIIKLFRTVKKVIKEQKESQKLWEKKRS